MKLGAKIPCRAKLFEKRGAHNARLLEELNEKEPKKYHSTYREEKVEPQGRLD